MNVLRGPRYLRIAPALLALFILGGCAAVVQQDPRRMNFPPVVFSPPEHRRVVTGNGTVLFFLPDHEVPLVNVEILVRTGGVLDPLEKTGLADIAGRVMRTGGTRRHSGRALNEMLENMGAVLETSVGREAGRASLSVLASDIGKGVELLAEVLRFPLFDEKELERVRSSKIEEIRRIGDDPAAIAYRELRAAVYGDDPRGRSPSPESVSRITREDLSAFHRRFFHPDRLIVGVSGDFRQSDFRSLWDEHFGDWEPSGNSLDPFPVPNGSPPPTVTLARKDFPQATILLGRLAPPIDTPDFYRLTLANYILGGAGFNSRLTREIRSNRGLAYSVGSWYRGDIGYGVLVLYCNTGPGAAREVTRLVRSISGEMSRKGVSEKELDWATEAIINGLIFAMDSTAEVLSRRISYEYDGLPEDFLERYPDRIKAVTLEEVRDTVRRYLEPERMQLIVVGDDRRFDGTFEEFGEMRIVRPEP